MSFLEKGRGARRAKPECLPLIKAEYKRLLPYYKALYKNALVSDRADRLYQAENALAGRDISQREIDVATELAPSTLSASAVRKECRGRIALLHPDWYEPIPSKLQPLWTRVPYGWRLHLLWLNLLLIPTRIRYMLKCTLKGSCNLSARKLLGVIGFSLLILQGVINVKE